MTHTQKRQANESMESNSRHRLALVAVAELDAQVSAPVSRSAAVAHVER